jgi:hypothetical protein
MVLLLVPSLLALLHQSTTFLHYLASTHICSPHYTYTSDIPLKYIPYRVCHMHICIYAYMHICIGALYFYRWVRLVVHRLPRCGTAVRGTSEAPRRYVCMYVCMCVYVCMYVCVCVCMCVHYGEAPRRFAYPLYTIIPSYHHTIIPLYHYTIIPFYHYTIIPFYHHVLACQLHVCLLYALPSAQLIIYHIPYTIYHKPYTIYHIRCMYMSICNASIHHRSGHHESQFQPHKTHL